MSRTDSSLSALGARWQALAPREQHLLLGASALVLLALAWWLALAPALQTLRSAGPRHSALDAQLQHMQSLQAEALQLQAQPRIRPEDAQRALQTSVAETLAAGIPTVVTDIGTFAEYPDDVVVKVPVDIDTERLAEVLVDLLADEARLEALSTAGRDYASRNTYDRAAQVLVENLLGAGRLR